MKITRKEETLKYVFQLELPQNWQIFLCKIFTRLSSKAKWNTS